MQGYCQTGLANSVVPTFFDETNTFQTAQQQYFASSSYLLNQANSAIYAAQSATNSATSASVQQYQGAQAANEIAANYGTQLAALCGIQTTNPASLLLGGVVTAGAPNATTPANCWLAQTSPSCLDFNTATGKPGCYRGTIGNAAYAYVAAVSSFQTAADQLTGLSAQIASQVAYCAQIAQDANAEAQVSAAYSAAMSTVNAMSTAAQGVKTLDWQYGELANSNFNIQTFAAVVQSEMSSGKQNQQFYVPTLASYEQLQLAIAYQEASQQLQQNETYQGCLNSLNALQSQNNATLDAVVTSLTQENQQLASLASQMQAAQQAIVSGLADYNSQTASPGATIYPYIANSSVRTLMADFTYAQNLLYLASRSLEYDEQQSLVETNQIYSVYNLADLTQIAQSLQGIIATGKFQTNSAPTIAELDLSLSKDLLQLSSASALQTLLMEPQNAAYDPNGGYLGQQLSFSLPLNDAYCAERFKWVSLDLLGTWNSGAQTVASLIVTKDRTFGSQWCNGSQATSMQIGTTYPGGNPFTNGSAPGDTWPVAPKVITMAVQANVNENITSFEDQTGTTVNGTEAAGTGLYGNYTLVFPAQTLTSFPSAQLQDVILRFEFVGVSYLH